MSTATITGPSLLEVLLDSLNDAYYYRRDRIEGCRDCTRNPAGVCPDHQEDNDLVWHYEQARKRIEHSPGDPELLAALGTEGSGS
jgi:hypothetical protein